MKGWIIAAIVLIAAGGILFTGVMFGLKWDFTKLSTTHFLTNEYAVTEKFTDIRIVGDTADVSILPSEDGKVKVVCREQEKLLHAVEVKDGVLTIEQQDTRNWIDFIGISFENTSVTVYLPVDTYGKLSIRLSTGDVFIDKHYTFTDVDLECSTGDVCLQDTAASSLSVKVTTGKVKVDRTKIQGEVFVKVSTGEATLNDVICGAFASKGNTGDLTLENVIASGKMEIERSTGDVMLEKCDAAVLEIETDTGDVKGTLLSDKVFLVETDTGRVSVPHSTSGGRCEVSTDTGDIQLTLAK